MKLFIYCAGGFGFEVADIAMRLNTKFKRWDSIEFIDDSEIRKTDKIKVSNLQEILDLYKVDNFEVVIANGEPEIVKKISTKLRNLNIKFATIIDETSVVSESAKISSGVIVCPFCSISSNAELGENVIVNTHSIVGHDVTVKDYSVISSMVNIGGASKIGTGVYVGMCSSIKELISIGDDSIIGMGSVVYNEIPGGVIALGNPARPMRKNELKKVFKN